MAFAALRAAFSGIVLIGAAEWLDRPAIGDRTLWGGVVLVGLTATSLGFFGMFYGGGRVSPGLATVIANTQPLIAAVLAWAYLNEHLSVVQLWGLLAGFGGVVLIGISGLTGTDSQFLGIIFILLAAIGIAVSNVALKRLAGRVDILRAMGWQLLIGALPLALLAMAIEDVRVIDWSVRFVTNLMVLSIFGTSVAFVLWFTLLQHATLSRLNVFTFLTPIFGLVLGAAFFAERLHTLELAGIGLSLLGIHGVIRSARFRASGTGAGGVS
jgi:drug/metabolite transporter (DMT)-like permease